MMDVDPIDAEMHPPPPRRRPARPVDDAHPFDLDAYIANYTARTAVDRLLYIIVTCPSIAPHALTLALARIHHLRDPALVQAALAAYAAAAANAEGQSLPPATDVAQVDPAWLERVPRSNAAERTKLEVELKTYTNNMIKESIRMAHRDLGEHYRATGDVSGALKHLTKSREFCSTSQHVLDMCLAVLELVIEQRNYAHIASYVYKADTALESAASATTETPKKTSPEREQIQSKLDFAMALSHLGQGNYEKAATLFLRLGPPAQLGDWIGKLVAPGDIAIYGTLCALASFSRAAVKSQLLSNPVFSACIEQEPYVRDLIQAYMVSDFKTTLEILSKYSTRHYIDIHLGPHVNDVTQHVRQTAIVLYFQPFETIRLDRMAAAFGWSIDEVEREVVALIQTDQILARVDSRNKILKATKTDHRAELFERAIKIASDIQSTNRKLLLRMRLQQADLIVRGPKSRRDQPQSLLESPAMGDLS